MITTAIVDSALVLTTIGTLIILSRLLLRRLKHEAFESDDYIMIVALAFYWLYTASYPIILENKMNLSIKDPKTLHDDDIGRIILGSKWILASRLSYLWSLWSMKTCMLIYYFRLEANIEEGIAILLAAGFLGMFWLGSMLALFLECRPLSLAWQVLPETPACARGIAGVITIGSADIATNLIIMAVPVPILWRAYLLFKHRIQILTLYILGFLVILFSIIRIQRILSKGGNVAIWGQLQLFFAVIAANGFAIRDLFSHGFNHMRDRHFQNNPDRDTESEHGLYGSQSQYHNRTHVGRSIDNDPEGQGTQNDLEIPDDTINITVVQETENTQGGTLDPADMEKKEQGRLSISWKAVRDRTGSSLRSRTGDGIFTHFELVQHTATGKMEDFDECDAPPPAMETFLGEGLGQRPMAKIRSDAFPGKGPSKHHHHGFFHREGNRKKKESSKKGETRLTGD